MIVHRAIMDTNVLYSALYSPQGVSQQVVEALRRGRWTAVVSNHLVTEYAEVCLRKSVDLGLSEEEISDVIDGVCAAAEKFQLSPTWVSQLPDPDDEPLLQLAVEAEVPLILSGNFKHLCAAASYGIEVLTPRQFLHKIGWDDDNPSTHS